MKRNLFLIFLIWAVCVTSAFSQAGSPPLNPVHVATALNHLTVLEFHEPVTMAAAGSSDFQIERQEDKVFIKPTKSGASTDLFVWTASRRFAYELETTTEVENMNVSVDNPLPPAPAAPPNSGFSAHVDELGDMMLTRAVLGAVDSTPANARSAKNQVRVRIRAQGNGAKHRSMVVEPSAYRLWSRSTPIGSRAYNRRAVAISVCAKSA